jgi:ligand-binding sensor domain-containing protein/two-component sensor histidine kinase
MKKLLTFIFVFQVYVCAFSQIYTDIYFDTYSTEYVKIQRGLSQNSILCLVQDDMGFLWIGTWDGLNRFDGYEFVVYKPGISSNFSNISNETVNDLFIDSHGDIWVGTDFGLNVFTPSEMIFTAYYQDTTGGFNYGENRVLSVSEGSRGQIWVGTVNGLYLFNKSTAKFSLLSFPKDRLVRRQPFVFELHRSESSPTMWVGTYSGLYRFDTNTLSYTDFSRKMEPLLPSDTVSALLEDSKGFLWAGTPRGIFLYDTKTGAKKVFDTDNSQLSSSDILSFMEDKEGRIWIGTLGGGIAVYDHATKAFESFGNSDQIYGGMTNNYIYSMLQTSNGSVWIGTWRGLNKFTPGKFRFAHVSAAVGKPLLTSNMVWSFLEIDTNTLWIGTENGINVFDRIHNRISVISANDNGVIRLPSDKIRAMYRDSRKRLWVGTLDKGLVCYDPSSGKNTLFFPGNVIEDERIGGTSVWSVIEDTIDNSIWIGTNGGVTRVFENGSVKQYVNEPGNPNSLTQDEVYHILQARDGRIWMATFSGVNVYNREYDHFVKFQADPLNGIGPATERILSVFQDSRGDIWFATMGEGLVRINGASGRLTTLTVKDGLANNTVYNLVEDRNENLWVTTNQGVSKISLETMNIWNYDIRDGIQGHEFNLGAAMILSNGEVVLGGMNGFNMFKPSNLIENFDEPDLYITRFSVYNQKRKDVVKNFDLIELSYWDNYFSFEFSALDYTNPKKINYAYKLDGFDNDWVYVTSDKRYADYTNIPPGKYTFKVKATNSDGLWSDKILSVYIEIAAPFWKTLWFKFVSALVLTFLIWYTVYSQMRKIRKKQEIERRIFEFEKNVFDLQQRILHLQMNPHFLFNSLNSVQSFIMKNDTDNAINYLSKFSNLMRLILTTSRTTNVYIQDEIKLLHYYLEIESLRFEHKFKYNIIVDKRIDEDFTAIPSHMIQPLVENCIKHGLLNKEGDGFVNIEFKLFENFIEVSIEDNGIGRTRAAEIMEKKKLQSSSQGIAITKERLNILNRQFSTDVFGLEYKDMFDADRIPSGTLAVLRVPFMDE